MILKRLQSELLPVAVMTAICLLITILLSYDFWSSARFYAPTPFHESLALPDFLSRFLLLLLLAALVVTAFFAFHISILASFALLALFIVLDQSRLQPYVYMYGATLLVLAICGAAHEKTARDSLRIMVACAYFWSGVQKINYEFFTEIFPWFISPYVFVSGYPADIPYNTLTENILLALVYTVPFFEALIGVLLLTMRKKAVPLAMAAIMLAIVLLSLGPTGLQHNIIVWPWNIWLFAMAVWLFRDHIPLKQLFHIEKHPASTAKIFIILFFGFLPLLSFWDRWDAYLSFKLYSGDKYVAAVSVEGVDKENLPAILKPHVMRGDMIPYLDVTLKHYNMVPYPEKRVYLNVWKHWCEKYNFTDSKLFITSVSGPFGKRERLEKYDCAGNVL